jgi:hypothetical protein
LRALRLLAALTTGLTSFAGQATAQEEILDPEDEPAESRASSAPPAITSASLSGYSWTELAADTSLDNGREAAGEWRSHFFLRATIEPTPEMRAVASVRLRHYMAMQRNESQTPFLFVNGENARSLYEAEPGESYLDLALPLEARLRVGLQLFSWGQNDLSPADPVNPRDLRWGLPVDATELKIPVFAVSASRNFAGIDVEASWLPFYTPSRAWLFGHDFSLFSPGGSVQPIDLDGIVPTELQDAIQSQLMSGVAPDASPWHSSAALRSTTSLAGVDLGVGYLFGWDRIPAIEFDPDLGQLFVELATPNPRLLTVSTLLSRLYPRAAAGEMLVRSVPLRQHTVVADAGIAVGDFVFKVDAAATNRQTLYQTRSGDPLSPVSHPTLAGAAGVDWRYGERLFVTAQWLAVQAFGVPDDEQLFLVAPRMQLLSQLVSWMVLPATLEVRVAAIEGITMGDWILQPMVTWRARGEMSLSAGLSLWGGNESGVGGFFSHNDAAFVRLRVAF